MEYRVLLDRKVVGQKDGVVYITEEGALLIWEAYNKMFPTAGQTMEQRERRGGICWLSEIRMWREKGFLPDSFDWTDYMIRFVKL
jgi:hypothetical protein